MWTTTEARALQVLAQAGLSIGDTQRIIDLLERAGFDLADRTRREMVCRWVSVDERAVPPEADTIIRTITTTTGDTSWSTTHWLDGLQAPR